VAIERILVATDLERKSEAALRHAAFLAGELGAELVVTHVVQSHDLQLEEGVHRPERVGDIAMEKAARHLEAHVAKVGLGGVASHIDVRFGDPALDVIASAVEHHCSLIVITVESRSRLGKLLLGSHAQQIILDSPIPVVGVKPDWALPE
jgi:nucleotide-binding universal stress UspA family protein